MAVNITGAFNMTRSALQLMGKGCADHQPGVDLRPCGLARTSCLFDHKGCDPGLHTESRSHTAPLGIRVNSISPGGIATDRLIELFGSEEAAEAHLAPLHPIGHTGRPADIANAVWYLASRRATFMTGADLLVDGGYTAQ